METHATIILKIKGNCQMYLQICAINTDSGQQERQALDSQYGEKKKNTFSLKVFQ